MYLLPLLSILFIFVDVKLYMIVFFYFSCIHSTYVYYGDNYGYGEKEK